MQLMLYVFEQSYGHIDIDTWLGYHCRREYSCTFAYVSKLYTKLKMACQVAAGNSGTNAANFSPGRVPSAITVGACNIADAMVSGSNFGPVVDLFAPGVNILSAWIGSPTVSV
jgi:hypothetical protein